MAINQRIVLLFPCFELLGQLPVITSKQPLWKRERYQLILKDSLISKGFHEAIEAVRSGRKVLVITNTVRMAQNLYLTLKERGFSSRNLKLLHSRFLYCDRTAKEEKVQRSALGTILLATQVVVSFDIDYDLLITELAPLDALLQRRGKVNRKGNRPSATILIRATWDRSSVSICGKGLLRLSLEILRHFPLTLTDRDLSDGTQKS